MKAFAYAGPSKPLREIELPTPVPAGAQVLVTGQTATEEDLFATIAQYTPYVFAFVLGLSFLLLLLVLYFVLLGTVKVTGVRPYYEFNGNLEVPLILVHGSWDSHHYWDRVVPRLTDSFRSSPITAAGTAGASGQEDSPSQESTRSDQPDEKSAIMKPALTPTQ